jgi:hypothetical protein
MMAASPYQVTGSITFPPDTGAPVIAPTASGSGQFTSRSDGILNLTGSGTQVVPIGTIPSAGAKILQIEVDPDTNPSSRTPILVKFNGNSDGVEISPGGSLQVHNPKPVAGTASLSISYTSDNVVRFWLLGD